MSEETGIMIKDRIEYWQNKYFEEKEKNKLLKSYSTNLPENVEMILLTKNDFERNISTDYISKDKIRGKIKELEEKIHVVTPDTHIIDKITEFKNEGALNILQELLEEE